MYSPNQSSPKIINLLEYHGTQGTKNGAAIFYEGSIKPFYVKHGIEMARSVPDKPMMPWATPLNVLVYKNTGNADVVMLADQRGFSVITENEKLEFSKYYKCMICPDLYSIVGAHISSPLDHNVFCGTYDTSNKKEEPIIRQNSHILQRYYENKCPLMTEAGLKLISKAVDLDFAFTLYSNMFLKD